MTLNRTFLPLAAFLFANSLLSPFAFSELDHTEKKTRAAVSEIDIQKALDLVQSSLKNSLAHGEAASFPASAWSTPNGWVCADPERHDAVAAVMVPLPGSDPVTFAFIPHWEKSDPFFYATLTSKMVRLRTERDKLLTKKIHLDLQSIKSDLSYVTRAMKETGSKPSPAKNKNDAQSTAADDQLKEIDAHLKPLEEQLKKLSSLFDADSERLIGAEEVGKDKAGKPIFRHYRRSKVPFFFPIPWAQDETDPDARHYSLFKQFSARKDGISMEGEDSIKGIVANRDVSLVWERHLIRDGKPAVEKWICN